MTVTATILSDGKPLKPEYELLSIDVQRELNRVPAAELALIDGDAAQRKFEISDQAYFEPGKPLEIKLRYEGQTDDATVFKGVVVRHGVESNGRASLLRVVAKDAAIGMTQVRRSEDFADKTEDQIFKAIIKPHAVEAGEIPSGLPKQPQMVQYDATDWDFLLSRADVLGLVVAVEDGKISLAKPEVKGSPKHTFMWGLSEIFEFELEADGGRQYRELSSVGWDVKQQKLTKPAEAKEPTKQQGNLVGGKLAEAFKFEKQTLVHPVDLPPKELEAWSDSRLARNRQALLRGRLAVPGLADVQLLDVMEIDGVGKRFNGRSIVSGLRHRIDEAGWRTDVQFGLAPDWYCTRDNIRSPAAAGLLPAVGGLQIGVVDKFTADPDKQFRVKVRLPVLGDKSKGIWARLAQPDAGAGRGYCFRPEKGDEVVLGFFNGDPRQAVILGALHSSKNKPPPPCESPEEKNVHKAIVSNKGTTIGFVDQDKASVFIETAGKNRITLDDDAESIEITDQHGNKVTMDKDGVLIKSAKDFKVDAGGNVEIKGAKVDIK